MIVLAVAGVIALIPILGFGQSIGNGFAISFITILIASFFFFFFNWFTSRRRAGKVLVDIIPYPNKTVSLIGAGLFILLGFTGGYSVFWRTSEYAWLISSVIGLCIGTMQILTAFSRIQVCENGILAYVDLVKWKKIESFSWADHNRETYTLKLRYRGRLPGFLRNGAIPVPVEKKAELESILEQYLPMPPASDVRNYTG